MSEFIMKTGDIITTAGQSIDIIWIIKSGRVRVEYAGGSYELGVGDVIGVCEAFLEVHFLNYVALHLLLLFYHSFITSFCFKIV